jgi:hypothetical protein
MEGVGAIWRSLTLGPVSIFSALALIAMAALGILSSRNVRFIWGVYLAAFIALAWAPVVWHKRALRDDPQIVAFVVTMTVGTFLGMIAFWAFFRFFTRKS